jgi:hypothetical protein
LAKKKLQIEIKGLVILGMSFLVDPPTLRDASCLMIWQRVNLDIKVQILEGEDVSPSQLLNLGFKAKQRSMSWQVPLDGRRKSDQIYTT